MKIISRSNFIAPVSVIIMLLIMLLSERLGITNGESASVILVSTVVLQIIVFVLPMVFYARIKDIKYTSDMMIRPFAFSRLGLIGSLLGVMLTGSFLINIMTSSASGGESVSETSQFIAISSEGGVFLTVIAVCVAPAICEEFAFRGVLLSEYKKYRTLPACLASAVLFAAIHLDLDAFMSNVFCGLVLAWLVVVTRSLLTSMILHALYNISMVFIVPYLWRVTLQPLGTLFVIFILAGIFLLCATLALGEAQTIYAEYARDPFKENETPNKKMGLIEGLCRVFLSPTFIVCIVILVITALVL